MDVPPYMIADGVPARTKAFNRINLEGHGFSDDEVRIVKEIYTKLYLRNQLRVDALKDIRKNSGSSGDLYDNVCSFFETSARGVC
jgi:UDP-N-acetylglucosamine acyltransferase